MLLLIDDEPWRVQSYIQRLRDIGYHVEIIEDAENAWEFFRLNQQKIRLIILDLMMPPYDDETGSTYTGEVLYAKIRGLSLALPIVVLTNVRTPEVLARFKQEVNCRCFLKRDIFPHELGDTVKAMLGD